MEREQISVLLRFFKALADESRLKIVGILAHQECSVEELATLLHLKEPTISHHLAKLKELDLVRVRTEGNTHLYQLNSEVLQRISKEILTPSQMASVVEDVEVDAWDRRVLSNYLDGDRLKEIPASYKKRLAILKWLASKFVEGVQYPEREVNEILKRHHPDCATLRRELVDNKFMQRANGVYWRTTNNPQVEIG